MQNRPYTELPGFERLYVEDSYVLDIIQGDVDLLFLLDLVLLPGHPLYRIPAPQEQYCYRRARVIFPNVRDVTWYRHELRKYTDSTGAVDYGNIDMLTWCGEEYHLEGDWGNVVVRSEAPHIDFDPAS